MVHDYGWIMVDIRERANHTQSRMLELIWNLNSMLGIQPKEMVFCYQNGSDLLWEKNVLVIKKNHLKFKSREFLKLLEQFIQTAKVLGLHRQ